MYELAKRINDRVDHIGMTRAKLLARTEVVYASNAAALNEFQAAERTIGKKILAQWWTALDERVRDTHRIRQARIYNFKTAETLLGEPNCRCSLLPYVPATQGKVEKIAKGTYRRAIKRTMNGVAGDIPLCITGLTLQAQGNCITSKNIGKVKRALQSHKPATRAVQQIAEQNEIKLAKALKHAIRLKDNEPFDVVVGGLLEPKHLIEVKTIVRGKNDKITMHKESLVRKKKQAAKFKSAKVWTVVFDERNAKIFYANRLGSMRLVNMNEMPDVSTLSEIIK